MLVRLIKTVLKLHKKNYPNTVQIGDVTKLTKEELLDLGEINILMGGSPCQNLSRAVVNNIHHNQGLKGEKSSLFYDYVRVLKTVKPKYFLFENVESMKNEDKEIITEIFEVEPIMINSSLVSAQDRKRYYWTNIPNISQPSDRNLFLRDIVESVVDEKYYLDKEKTEKLIAQLEDRTEPQVLRPQRTEYGKQIRKKYEAGEIQESRHNMTELQPRKDSITNTLTSVQKDNLLAEPQNGLPIREATKKGYAIAQEGDSVNFQFPDSKTRRGRVGKGIANTLEASAINQGVVETNVAIKKVESLGNVNPSGRGMNGKVYSVKAGLSPTLTTNKGEGAKFLQDAVEFDIVKATLTPDRLDKRQNGRRFKEDGEPSFTINTQDRHGITYTEKVACEERSDEGLRFFKDGVIGTLRTIDSCGDKRVFYSNYKIRKLTPLECWRLQGFLDSYFYQAKNSGMSDSQLYHQAGNAVTVNVIKAIGEKLLNYL